MATAATGRDETVALLTPHQLAKRALASRRSRHLPGTARNPSAAFRIEPRGPGAQGTSGSNDAVDADLRRGGACAYFSQAREHEVTSKWIRSSWRFGPCDNRPASRWSRCWHLRSASAPTARSSASSTRSFCDRCRTRSRSRSSSWTSAVPEQQLVQAGFSWPRMLVVRERQQVFSDLSVSTPNVFNVTGSGDPEQVQGMIVSSNYFRCLACSRCGDEDSATTKTNRAARRS